MRKLLVVLMVLIGVLVAVLIYERLFVEKTFGPSAMAGLAGLGSVFLFLWASFVLYNTRHRELIGNLWLVGASVIVSYVVLDLAAGWMLIRPLSPPLVPDAYRHHKLVPDSYSHLEQRDFSYVQRVNHHGLRGKEIPAQRDPGRYRILMLGDSFTMGKGVEDDQTFPVLVEQSLNGRAATCEGRPVEVLNGGVDSYAPVLSRLQLERDLEPLAPDLVMLNFDVSDLAQEQAYRRDAVYGPDGDIVAVPQGAERVSVNERIRMWAERHLFFTRALLYYTNQMLGYRSLTARDVITQANLEIAAHTLASDTVNRDAQWQNVFDSIERIHAFCVRKGIEFVLTVYPWAHQVSDVEWVPGRYTFMAKDARPSDRHMETLKAFAARQGITFLDVFPTFRRHQGGDPLYFNHDMHWTVAGQRVMAQGIEEHLRRHYPPLGCR